MIEDMTVRNFVEKTRNDYIRHVRSFTAFLGRSPDSATPEDLRRFQLHQTQTGMRPRSSPHWVRPLTLPTSRPLHHLTTGRMVCSVICLVRHPVMYLLLHRGAICLRVNPVNMLATRF
jgi:hypothetical protein